MRIDQIKPLRWLLAELVVIVLGILIAFQVEEWRQMRENKALEAKAFVEVLYDLDSIEQAVTEAVETIETSTRGAVNLVGLIQSGGGSQEDFLENIAQLDVYMIGLAKSTYAYEGLLAAGRFAAVDNPELTVNMRLFFTRRKPWIYARNMIHIDHFDELLDEVYVDVRRVPDKNFFSTLKSHEEISVPVDEFLNSPQVMDALLGFVRRSQRMEELFQMLLDDIEQLREDINLHLGSLPSSPGSSRPL